MSASTTASSNHTINSLKLNTRNTALTLSSSLGNFLLTVQDGGILETVPRASAQMVNITGGSLTAGTAGVGGEMVITSALFTAGNVYRFGISSPIVDNAGGPVSLTIGAANNASGRTAVFFNRRLLFGRHDSRQRDSQPRQRSRPGHSLRRRQRELERLQYYGDGRQQPADRRSEWARPDNEHEVGRRHRRQRGNAHLGQQQRQRHIQRRRSKVPPVGPSL